MKKVLEATGHSFVTQQEEATCTEGGYEQPVCLNCGCEGTRKLTPATGHRMEEQTVPADCDEPGGLWNVCTVCGERELLEEIPATGHSICTDEITVSDMSGTVTQAVCTACGKTVYYAGFAPLNFSWAESVFQADILSTYQLPVITVYSSAVQGYNYPANTVDGDSYTYWQSDETDTGIPWLWYELDQEYDLCCIYLDLGNWKSEDSYYAFGTPKTVTFAFDTGSPITVEFPQGKSKLFFLLTEPVRTKTVTLTIDESYPGWMYAGTCVTGASFYGQ